MNKKELIRFLQLIEKYYAVDIKEHHNILFDEYELEETIAVLNGE